MAEKFDFTRCRHCQQPLSPESRELALHPGSSFCCKGCEVVFTYLQQADLQGYHRMLEDLNFKEESQKRSLHKQHTSSLSWANWDQPEMRELFTKRQVPALEGRSENLHFFVPSLICAACVTAVEHGISRLFPGTKARVNLFEKMIQVEPGPTFLLSGAVCYLHSLGLNPLPPLAEWGAKAQTHLDRSRMIELGISGALFAQVMLFSIAVYFGNHWGMTNGDRQFFMGVCLVLTIPSVFWGGRSFFKNAWMGLKNRTIHMDFPILFALLLAFSVSILNLFKGSSDVYFDSITGLVFLLLAGRSIYEALLQQGKRLSQLSDTLLPADSKVLKPGDVITVAYGQVVGADAKVIQGETVFQEAVITGETLPVYKKVGSEVLAGTTNLGSSVTLEVLRTGAFTAIGQMLECVRQAQTSRSGMEQISSKLVHWFTIVTLVVAWAVGMFWWFQDPSQCIRVVTSTLIVSCPCALGLSIPLSRAMALRRFWKRGVVLKSAQALENISKISTVVLDKTGTLSDSQLNVKNHFSNQELNSSQIREIFGFSSQSTHPVSKAVAKYMEILMGHQSSCDWNSSPEKDETQGAFLPHGQNIQEFPGKGWAGGEWLMGTQEFVLEKYEKWTHFVDACLLERATSRSLHLSRLCFLASSDVCVGFELEESWREGCFQVLEELHQENLTVKVATGDSYFIKETLDQYCKFDLELKTGLSPVDKAEWLKNLQSSGEMVLFVGDGVNDAPALSQADVGLAMGAGADMAIASSHGYLRFNQPRQLASILRAARYESHTLKAVLFLSGSYNVMAVALSAMGKIHPLVAALIMPMAGISGFLISYFRKGNGLWKY
jgi:heavy metal translocating P-type ATPase